MLKLSDADLARLRLECWRAAHQAAREGTAEDFIGMYADRLVAFCLRDRPTEPEET